jgi:CHASE3 domain sensor protein
MGSRWTFGQKLGAGFAVVVALTMVIGAISIYALLTVRESKDRVIAVNAQNLVDARRLDAITARKSAALRGYLLTGDTRFADEARTSRREFERIEKNLANKVDSEELRQIVAEIGRTEDAHEEAADRVIAARAGEGGVEEATRLFDTDVIRTRDALDAQLVAFVANEERMLEDAREQANRSANSAITLVIVMSILIFVLATIVAVVLARTLSRQIGTAVSQVQSSSTELQAAANQQATGAREQSTAMNEISTTITELLATSRQIAESAQRVAQIASQTASAARSGSGTVDKATDWMGGIRRQVDQIVTHMLELGKKSQQIGAVVEIVSELAEQTNILAINATIEAAGAGESGKRFAIVADEIRKLSDRVTGSAKEIRGLIDDVRSAVNTTVMATESGSKAVDQGTRQFSEVASSFGAISGLVSTTTEAAREIELSTKQQSTAVEQVNVAIANVAQATRETETSSGQTLQTASELAGLSRELLKLTQPQASA